MDPFRIEAASRAPNLLHLLPMLTLGFLLQDPHFLKEHISGVEDTARVSRVGAFLTTKAGMVTN